MSEAKDLNKGLHAISHRMIADKIMRLAVAMSISMRGQGVMHDLPPSLKTSDMVDSPTGRVFLGMHLTPAGRTLLDQFNRTSHLLYPLMGGGRVGLEVKRAAYGVAVEQDFMITNFGGTLAPTDDLNEIRYQASRTVQPGTIPEDKDLAVGNAIWRYILEWESNIEDNVEKQPFTVKDFIPEEIVERLVAVDLSGFLPVAQCYYLYILLHIFDHLPLTERRIVIIRRVQELIAAYQCEDVMRPVNPTFTTELDTVLDATGGISKESLGDIISGYASVPPDHATVIARLLSSIP